MILLLMVLNMLALNNLPYGEGVYKTAIYLLVSLTILTVIATMRVVNAIKNK